MDRIDAMKVFVTTLEQGILAGAGRQLGRLYGGTIGIAVVLVFFYDKTQAMHVALAKGLTPYRAAALVAGSIAEPGLAALNHMSTDQAAFVGIIDQFKVMMIAMLIVSPLPLCLRKLRPAGQQGV